MQGRAGAGEAIRREIAEARKTEAQRRAAARCASRGTEARGDGGPDAPRQTQDTGHTANAALTRRRSVAHAARRGAPLVAATAPIAPSRIRLPGDDEATRSAIDEDATMTVVETLTT